jgi:DNA repair protein RadC
MNQLKNIPIHDWPRERLLEKGAKTLSDADLLAVLLGKGTKDCDVLSVSRRILKIIDEQGLCPNLSALQEIPGIGPAKAALIAAALEFSRRRIRPEGLKISFPPDVLPLIRHFSDRKQEHFLCVSLNGANEVIATRVVAESYTH